MTSCGLLFFLYILALSLSKCVTFFSQSQLSFIAHIHCIMEWHQFTKIRDGLFISYLYLLLCFITAVFPSSSGYNKSRFIQLCSKVPIKSYSVVQIFHLILTFLIISEKNQDVQNNLIQATVYYSSFSQYLLIHQEYKDHVSVFQRICIQWLFVIQIRPVLWCYAFYDGLENFIFIHFYFPLFL